MHLEVQGWPPAATIPELSTPVLPGRSVCVCESLGVSWKQNAGLKITRKYREIESNLVEAMGVEPMSVTQSAHSATCLVFISSYKGPQRHVHLISLVCDHSSYIPSKPCLTFNILGNTSIGYLLTYPLYKGLIAFTRKLQLGD